MFYQQQGHHMMPLAHSGIARCFASVLIALYLIVLLVVIGYLTGGIGELYAMRGSSLSIVDEFSLIVEPVNQITCLLVLVYGGGSFIDDGS